MSSSQRRRTGSQLQSRTSWCSRTTAESSQQTRQQDGTARTDIGVGLKTSEELKVMKDQQQPMIMKLSSAKLMQTTQAHQLITTVTARNLETLHKGLNSSVPALTQLLTAKGSSQLNLSPSPKQAAAPTQLPNQERASNSAAHSTLPTSSSNTSSQAHLRRANLAQLVTALSSETTATVQKRHL